MLSGSIVSCSSRYLVYIAVLAIIYTSCSGGGGGDTTPVVDPTDDMITGQAILGPLCNSKVDVYQHSDLLNPIYTTSTSDSDILSEAGVFSIPKAVIEGEEFYIIVVSGGEDIDADDDGYRDRRPTDNLGTLHLMATGEQLKSGTLRANILSEMIYRNISYLLLAQYPKEAVIAAINQHSKVFIKEDVDGDGDRDYNDILAWHPVDHRSNITFYHFHMQSYIDSVHNGYYYLSHHITKNTYSRINTPNNPHGFAISGDYVYSSGLDVSDISDLAEPEYVGYELDNTVMKDIAVSGNHLFTASSYSGVQIFNVNDPTNPELIGSVESPGDIGDSANSIVISGSFAYVANGYLGLYVIDISDPTSAAIVGSVDTSGRSADVTVSGDFAYLADSTLGLQVYDIRDPYDPIHLGTVGMPGTAVAVDVYENTAFVADSDFGIQVIDVSSASNPIIIHSIDTPGMAMDIKIAGGRAYVADYDFGIHVIDIANPASAKIIGSIETHSIGHPSKLQISGNYVFVACGPTSNIKVFDISDVSGPEVVKSVDTPGRAKDVEIAGSTIYLADGAAGLQVIDISDGANPVLIGTQDTPGNAQGVAVLGNVAYVADGDAGLQIIDIQNSTSLVIEGTVDTPGSAQGVAVWGDHAYVADGDAGLQVIDISNNTSPVIVGVEDTPGYAYNVVISGDYAYVADGEEGLQIIDISDKNNPFTTGAVKESVFTAARNLAVSGNYAYVNYDWDLHVVDIRDKSNPEIVGFSPTGGIGMDVKLLGSRAYVTGEHLGISIIDIGNPLAPEVISITTSAIGGYGLSISGNYVYIAENRFGLSVLRTIP